MNQLNSLILEGNVCKDPEIKEINIPANVTKMSEYSVCDNKNTVTINAPKGSYAENYVKTYGKTNKLEFKAVE